MHRLESLPQGVGADVGAPLYALHGTAYSGRTFAALMGETPRPPRGGAGHAGLRRLDPPARALDHPAVCRRPRRRDRGPQARRASDLLGYHTGALIALQIAADRPDLVRRLVLIGVPYFSDPKEREAWRARLAESMRLAERLDQFDERWDLFW